jgi:hypothetical protein
MITLEPSLTGLRGTQVVDSIIYTLVRHQQIIDKTDMLDPKSQMKGYLIMFVGGRGHDCWEVLLFWFRC